MKASRELMKLLNLAYQNHRNILDLMIENALSDIETAYETGMSVEDLRYIAEDYARQASQEANEYYQTIRKLWEQAGLDMGELPPLEVLDPDRALWQVMGGFNDTDFAGLTYTQVKEGKSRARLTMADLWAKVPYKNMDDMQVFMSDLMNAADRQTQLRNMRLDPKHPRYARVPKGAKTCAFCLMLASRGFVYSTRETAGEGLEYSYHSHCDCAIVPEFGEGTEISGYNPARYRAIYENAKKVAKSTNYREILKTMRRQAPDRVKDGVYPAPSMSWENSKKLLSMRGQSKGTLASWQKRQIAVGVPLKKEILEYHEIVFLEKFKQLGYTYEWIPKSSVGQSTNDFIWYRGDESVFAELKSMHTTKYRNIAARISDAVEKAEAQDVIKDVFIIDLGDSKLKPKELYQYSLYNARHEKKIKELWIWHSEGFTRIDLK